MGFCLRRYRQENIVGPRDLLPLTIALFFSLVKENLSVEIDGEDRMSRGGQQGWFDSLRQGQIVLV